jgi:hypothetical protein
MLPGVHSMAFAENEEIPAIERTYRELRAYQLPDEQSSEDREFPQRIRLLQKRFKHQLHDLVADVLNQDADSIARPTADILTAIRARLKSVGLDKRPNPRLSLFSFGHVRDLKVQHPQDHPELLVVGLITDAGWAEEESLYIFQHQAAGWVHVLSAEVNGYSTAWGAQSSYFEYGISSSVPDGSWFVVTCSVNPAMLGPWRRITYSALAPSGNPDRPRILMRNSHSIYFDDELHVCHIKTTVEGFRVRFPLAFSPNEERYTDEYHIAAGTAHRIAERCRTKDLVGRYQPCDTGDRSFAERLEKTYNIIKKHTPE